MMMQTQHIHSTVSFRLVFNFIFRQNAYEKETEREKEQLHLDENYET